jgi:hypothetical protein
VFSGTIIMDGEWNLAFRNQLFSGPSMRGLVNTTLKVIFIQANLRKDVFHGPDMKILAIERTTKNGDFFFSEVEVVSCSCFNHWQGLEGFGAGSQAEKEIRVTHLVEDLTL